MVHIFDTKMICSTHKWNSYSFVAAIYRIPIIEGLWLKTGLNFCFSEIYWYKFAEFNEYMYINSLFNVNVVCPYKL